MLHIQLEKNRKNDHPRKRIIYVPTIEEIEEENKRNIKIDITIPIIDTSSLSDDEAS